ncbi:MAG: precorrin-8X methylmutase, partial [Actinomycetota bacterium]|nr:precorrin-8X methylmutase [Actinomycetota bacterium]
MSVHPIEQESYRILEERIDLTGLAPLGRAVVARVAHATADLDLARSMVLDEAELEMAVRALRDGAPVVADVVMVAAGITGRRARSFLDQVPTGVPATSAATSGVAGVPAT